MVVRYRTATQAGRVGEGRMRERDRQKGTRSVRYE